MTFLELQDAVLEVFTTATADRDNAKRWLNLRYGQLWSLERWTFRYATDDVAVAAGSIDVTSEAPDLGHVLGLWNAEGDPLGYLRPRVFYDVYQEHILDGSTGRPRHFTVLNGQIQVGPPSDETSSVYRTLYLKTITDLSANGDVPAFPDEYHWLLVHGAQATGQVVKQDPNAPASEQAWLNGLDLLRRDYLEDADNIGEQWPADTLGWTWNA